MPDIDKKLLRLATAIRAQLAAASSQTSRIELPHSAWSACEDLVRQQRRAELRRWPLAAAVLERDLLHSITSLVDQLNALTADIERQPATPSLATGGDIYRDLLDLNKDFDQLDFDVRGRWLSVTTEPITLQGIYLGPFEIRLEWNRIERDAFYRVIACDPHPAESRENVTHPHVMDERLCEGESRVAIRQALLQGRLWDFFTLVAGGLRSYNSDSPYVGLEIWHGASCTDCGGFVDDDEGYTCHACNSLVCGGCECSCCQCGSSFCAECVTACEVCRDYYCRDCRSVCRGCQQPVCSGCLEEDERCANCHEQQETNDRANAAAEAAVQSHGLGQAPLPAGCG